MSAWSNDMHAISLLMQFYNAKTKAAEQVLLYGYDHDATHLAAGRDACWPRAWTASAS